MSSTLRTALRRHDRLHPDGRAFHFYGALGGEFSASAPRHEPGAIHLRRDLLSDAWIGVSPARNTRPGGLADIDGAPATTTASVASCPLCPGGPEVPFAFDAAVFDNRFPALSPLVTGVSTETVAPAVGRCEVVVYTSDHEGSLSTLPPAQVAKVVAIWRDRSGQLWDDGYGYVMAFENHGPEVGATLSHPHGQIYALPFVPPVIATKLSAHRDHRRRHGACLGCDLVAGDDRSDRGVRHDASFSVAVPFAARWPFEVHLRARRHGCGRLADLTDDEALDLAKAIQDVTLRYDGLFGFELPYLLCVQEAPDDAPDWHLHVELLPPHRDADRLKVRASVETALGVFLNDTLPERSAARLAGVSIPTSSWHEVVVPNVHHA